MAFSAAHRDHAIADINVTPLVDVLLVLLIIFMLATPLLETPLGLALPQVGPGRTAPAPETTLELAIDAEGGWAWQGQRLPVATVQGLLALEAQRQPQPLLRIAANADASYQPVLAALVAARAAGLERVALDHD
jgi:biopolymer transport protein ExbD